MTLLRGMLCSALLATAAANATPEPAKEIENLERELVAAIARTDLATYDRVVADDYIAIEPSGREISKAEVMASYRSGARRYTNLEISDVRGRVFGDAGIVIARTSGLRREGDRDVPNDVRYIRVYARRDGRWRAVAQMSTPAPPNHETRTPPSRIR